MYLSREVFYSCTESHLCTIVSYYMQMLTPQNMWMATQESRHKCHPPAGASLRYIAPEALLRSASARGRREERPGWIGSMFRLQRREPDLRRGRDSRTSQLLLSYGTRRDLDGIPRLHHSSFNKELHKSDKTTVWIFFLLCVLFFPFLKWCGSTWCLANWHTMRRMMSV